MAEKTGRGSGSKSNEDQEPTTGAGEDKVKDVVKEEVPVDAVMPEVPEPEVPSEHVMATPAEQVEVAVEVKVKKYKIVLMHYVN